MIYLIALSLLLLAGCRSAYTTADCYRLAVSYIDTADFVSDFYSKEISVGVMEGRDLPTLAVFDTASFIIKNTSFAKEIYTELSGVSFDSLSVNERERAYRNDYKIASSLDKLPLPSVDLPVFHGRSKFVLFFSPIFDDMMIAEIVPVRNRSDTCLSYSCLIGQNRTLKMLFICNGDYIRKMDYVVVQYE